MGATFGFERAVKWGAAAAAAVVLSSCVGGCVSDLKDDRAIDASVTQTMIEKGEGQYKLDVNGVNRIGLVKAGKPVVYRGTDAHGHGRGTPVLLNGKDESCLIGRFKVVGGIENLPTLKWMGLSSRDITKTVHMNPSNIGLDCATGVESLSTIPASVAPAPAPAASGMR